jgi:hypothetical protein
MCLEGPAVDEPGLDFFKDRQLYPGAEGLTGAWSSPDRAGARST